MQVPTPMDLPEWSWGFSGDLTSGKMTEVGKQNSRNVFLEMRMTEG